MTDARCTDEITVPHFREIVGRDPFPWQQCLYGEFVEGRVREALDIPTGLGKTLCILLFLLARIRNTALPTRIVYVVDRRAIVDQTAEAIRAWIDRIASLPQLARVFSASSAFPSARPVHLGILRGGLADDGEWRVDPARPAVIVGTVDMIGSRILFSGYGDGRSRRPMHAGLLGYDSIVMLDEAHLSPAMGALIRSINRIQNHPKFWTMTLSATSTDGEDVFRLGPRDEADPRVRRRLHSVKAMKLHKVDRPSDRIDDICKAAAAHQSGSIAVFIRTVEDARKIHMKLIKVLGESGPRRVALLAGTLRGKERTELAAGAVWRRFLPNRDRKARSPSVFLVMTSAGEVGVDLDADHGVMDLGTLDSMIQRVGRVNRMGLADATVTIVFTKKEATMPPDTPKTNGQRLDAARARTLEELRRLPDLAPATLGRLDKQALKKCSVSPSQPGPLHAEVVEAFAATSATLQLPRVAIYLRGVSDQPDPPESFLVWRRDIPVLVERGKEFAAQAIAFFRPRPGEIARVPSSFARDLVKAAVERQDGGGLPLVMVEPGGDVRAMWLENGEEPPPLDYATVVLPTTAGGLETSGLPLKTAGAEVADVGDGEDRTRYESADGKAILADEGGQELLAWLEQAIELRVPLHGVDEENGEERSLVYALRRPDPALQTAEGDLTWIGASTQTVDEHCSLVGDTAWRIGKALQLRLRPYEVDALEIAGRWHDRGKARQVWQRAAGVPRSGPLLAKSKKGRLRPELLGGYRHEFGSLAEAEREVPMGLPGRELALHLIAAHHGWARPGFPYPRQWDPDVPSALNRRLAIRAADRFACLQAEHGPWRLAWLEALLKAADAYVSSDGGK